MVVCDRCEGQPASHVSVTLGFPTNHNPNSDVELARRDLCERCQSELKRQVKAWLAPLDKVEPAKR
jgi:hypothetical protein